MKEADLILLEISVRLITTTDCLNHFIKTKNEKNIDLCIKLMRLLYIDITNARCGIINSRMRKTYINSETEKLIEAS